MQLSIKDHHGLVAEALVARVRDAIQSKPNAVIGVATGRTPMEAYRLLALERESLDLSRARFVMLDEYLGLASTSPDSFQSVLRRQVLKPLGLRDEQLIVMASDTKDVLTETLRFERKLAKCGGVDLQILGVGRNGHIGFNEPGSRFDSLTRRVSLTYMTRSDNAPTLIQESTVPVEAMTQGIATILRARSIVVIATGEAKAPIIARALNEPASADLPISALRAHAACELIVDRDAVLERGHAQRRELREE